MRFRVELQLLRLDDIPRVQQPRFGLDVWPGTLRVKARTERIDCIIFIARGEQRFRTLQLGLREVYRSVIELQKVVK